MTVLGCAHTYRATVHFRGGGRVWTPVDGVIDCEWSRVLDDSGEATVTVAKQGVSSTCCARLGNALPWGHELSVYRDDALVWQGPLVKVGEDRTTFILYGRDMFAWLDRRVNQGAFAYTATDSAEIARQLILNGIGEDDPGLVAFLRVSASGVPTDRAAGALQVYVGAEVRELARAGLDFTTIGRSIVLAGELATLAPRTVLLAEKHLDGNMIVERTGAESTFAAVVGEGVTGLAGGGGDPFYGRLDSLVKASGTLDVQAAQAQAQAIVAAGKGPVTVLRLDDASALTPTAPISVPELVCGARIDVATSDLCSLIARTPMRLTRVMGRFDEAGERIAVSLTPFVEHPQVVGL